MNLSNSKFITTCVESDLPSSFIYNRTKSFRNEKNLKINFNRIKQHQQNKKPDSFIRGSYEVPYVLTIQNPSYTGLNVPLDLRNPFYISKY